MVCHLLIYGLGIWVKPAAVTNSGFQLVRREHNTMCYLTAPFTVSNRVMAAITCDLNLMGNAVNRITVVICPHIRIHNLCVQRNNIPTSCMIWVAIHIVGVAFRLCPAVR